MPATFDKFSENYRPGNKSLLKKILGGDFERYIQTKVEWLIAELRSRPLAPTSSQMRLLDFGCGTGEFIRLLINAGFEGDIRGCDVSTGMLETGTTRWTLDCPAPFDHFDGITLPYDPSTFNVVVSSCVFHHIKPALRKNIYRSLFNILAPGGKIVIFEHNPYHPLTCYAVSRAPEDADAVLLAPKELIEALNNTGFTGPKSRSVLVLPPRFPGSTWIDRTIGFLPIGAQYAIVAEKPNTGF